MDTPEHTFYGLPQLNDDKQSPWAGARQKLLDQGYFVLEKVFEPAVVREATERLKHIYDRQADEIGGAHNLKAINEENTVRMPFLYDEFFLQFFSHSRLLEVLKAVYCDTFILLIQTGLMNVPQKKHVAAAWHKDLPYQHYASRQPICINALVALSDFTEHNGSTCFIKGSHEYVEVPDDQTLDQQQVQVTAPAGSVIFFNSLLFHRMGQNNSGGIRYAMNHMFGTPIFKQHANFHKMSNGKYKDDPLLSKLLDYPYAVPDSVLTYRQNKLSQKKSQE